MIPLFTLLMVIFCFLGRAVGSDCPSGFDSSAGVCVANVDQAMTWDDAQATCQSMGGANIFTVDTSEKFYDVYYDEFVAFWIGLRFEPNGSAHWADGSELVDQRLVRWDNIVVAASKAQQDAAANGAAQCIVMDNYQDGYWTNYACDDPAQTFVFYCYVPLPPAPAPAPALQCLPGFTNVGGRCFKLVSGSFNQTNSVSTCKAFNNTEVYHFADSQQTMVDIMTTLNVFPSTNTNMRFWVDASPSGDNWVYLDNTTVPRNPAVPKARPITNCIMAVLNGVNQTFGWQHATCTNKYGLVCEQTA